MKRISSCVMLIMFTFVMNACKGPDNTPPLPTDTGTENVHDDTDTDSSADAGSDSDTNTGPDTGSDSDTNTGPDAGSDSDTNTEMDAGIEPTDCEDPVSPDCCGFDTFVDGYTDTIDIGICPGDQSVYGKECSLEECTICVWEFLSGKPDCGYERYICFAGEWHLWGHFEISESCYEDLFTE